jgi:hypothetical protein
MKGINSLFNTIGTLGIHFNAGVQTLQNVALEEQEKRSFEAAESRGEVTNRERRREWIKERKSNGSDRGAGHSV